MSRAQIELLCRFCVLRGTKFSIENTSLYCSGVVHDVIFGDTSFNNCF